MGEGYQGGWGGGINGGDFEGTFVGDKVPEVVGCWATVAVEDGCALVVNATGGLGESGCAAGIT